MTSPSPLDRLAGPGNILAKEPLDAKEFTGLVRSGLARLKDAENDENSLDSRFDLAYSAAHALCLAALRHHGFRPSKRYIVFQVLPDTQKGTRLNSSHVSISYAVFCLKKKKKK